MCAANLVSHLIVHHTKKYRVKGCSEVYSVLTGHMFIATDSSRTRLVFTHVMLALSSVIFFLHSFFSRANQLLACIYLAQSVRVRKKFIIWKREKNFTGQKAARRLKVLVMLCSLNFLIHFASTNAGPISEVHRTYVV